MANQEEVEICSDLLEVILSYVPFVDLVSAADVSRSWGCAVASSLRHHNKPMPWLILHTQGKRNPHATTAKAYDRRSQLWVSIRKPSVKYVAALRSSHSGFLYMLSPSRFSFSSDPFNFEWLHVDPPLVWRTDPIVARVGESVVVAGGACDFEDDPLAVEIYSLRERSWCACESMPGIFKESAASQWQSIATTAEKLFITDNKSGLTHSFDPATKSWSEPVVLNPGQPVSHFNIGSSSIGKLILVGLCRIENVERVKIWRFDPEDFSDYEEIGDMPSEYVEKLRSECFGIPSMKICASGNVVYMYNPSEVEELVACELSHDGGCRWWTVRNAVTREDMMLNQLVFSCSEVGIDDLRRVMKREGGELGGAAESFQPLPRRI
ncbi:F-box/kelch-repeat protein-like [Dorcoceras hygrometricum]|uniref:F-box/kelch-repeat protein-like n=1 Tax=Dorcoceras hygrometricum TaxID=472368 RepID=A0A2Z7CZJ5_9LAMI|nr:F-box/kelch-repeat protein-like [Dorcoceras hygrometricum]